MCDSFQKAEKRLPCPPRGLFRFILVYFGVYCSVERRGELRREKRGPGACLQTRPQGLSCIIKSVLTRSSFISSPLLTPQVYGPISSSSIKILSWNRCLIESGQHVLQGKVLSQHLNLVFAQTYQVVFASHSELVNQQVSCSTNDRFIGSGLSLWQAFMRPLSQLFCEATSHPDLA